MPPLPSLPLPTQYLAKRVKLSVSFFIVLPLLIVTNFGPGKTAALIGWFGRGAATHRRILQQDFTTNSSFLVASGKKLNLPVVGLYKHMGSKALANSSCGPEIAYRNSTCACALKPLRHNVFRNAKVPPKAAGHMAQNTFAGTLSL